MLRRSWISNACLSILLIYSALEKAKDQDPKVEPDYSYLQSIKVAVSIIHLLNAYINTALIPLASSSLTIRRDMTNYCSTNISALEKKVNSIFQTVFESTFFVSDYLMGIAVMSGTSHRLSKQKKNDFKLREDDGSLTNLQTEVAFFIPRRLNSSHVAM
jgi:exocyst complex component 5